VRYLRSKNRHAQEVQRNATQKTVSKMSEEISREEKDKNWSIEI